MVETKCTAPTRRKLAGDIEAAIIEFADLAQECTRSDLQGMASARAGEIARDAMLSDITPTDGSNGVREEIVGGQVYRWDGVEVAACYHVDNDPEQGLEPITDPAGLGDLKVAVVSVYLHRREGGVVCIADCASAADALLIGRALAQGTAFGLVDRTWHGCKVES